MPLPKSIHSISESRTLNFGTTNYFAYGTGRLREDGTETNRQVVVRTAGRISSLLLNLPVNTADGTTVVTLRKNGSPTVVAYTILAGAIGSFETRSDLYVDVVAGDLLCYECVVNGTSGSISWGQISTTFQAIGSANKTCVTRLVCNGVSGSITPASTTRFCEIAGDNDLSGTAEADKVIKLHTAGTMSELGVYVSANTRSTDTVVTLRINAGNGTLTVTIPGGGTGWFEDTSNTDNVASGDDLDWQVVTGTGTGTITIQVIASSFKTTNNTFPIITSFVAGVSVNFNVTTYTSYGGLSNSTTESFRSVINRMRLLVSGLYAYVFSNTIATNDTAITLRVGKTNSALTLAVVAGGTGAASNTTNKVFHSPVDAIIFQTATPNTSGALNIRSIAVICEYLETPKIQAIGNAFRSTVYGKKHVHMGAAN